MPYEENSPLGIIVHAVRFLIPISLLVMVIAIIYIAFSSADSSIISVQNNLVDITNVSQAEANESVSSMTENFNVTPIQENYTEWGLPRGWATETIPSLRPIENWEPF